MLELKQEVIKLDPGVLFHQRPNYDGGHIFKCKETDIQHSVVAAGDVGYAR